MPVLFEVVPAVVHSQLYTYFHLGGVGSPCHVILAASAPANPTHDEPKTRQSERPFHVSSIQLQ